MSPILQSPVLPVQGEQSIYHKAAEELLLGPSLRVVFSVQQFREEHQTEMQRNPSQSSVEQLDIPHKPQVCQYLNRQTTRSLSVNKVQLSTSAGANILPETCSRTGSQH